MDAKADVVAAHDDSTLSLLWGNGTGAFASRLELRIGDQPKQVAAADVNGDGHTDLLTLGASSATVFLHLAQPGDTFISSEISLGAATQAIAVDDLDHDSRPDLIAAVAGGILALPGHGDGTFGAGLLSAGPSGLLALGDLDGDGHADAVIAEGCSPGESCLWHLRGNGDGTFTPATAIPATIWFATDLWLTDLNRDAALDLIAVRRQSFVDWYFRSIVILMGNGDGSFQPDSALDTGSYKLAAAAVTDWNADGTPDLFFSSAGANGHDHCDYAAALIGNGDGTFTNTLRVPLPPSVTAASSTDLDGDGLEEIVAAQENWVCVVPGDVNARAPEVPVGRLPTGVATADFDGDNASDLAVANRAANSVSVLLARHGTLTASADYPTGSGPRAVTTGDVNHDGSPDLVVANELGSSVSILTGHGDGTFAAAGEFGVGTAPVSVRIGDFDANGDADLVVASPSTAAVVVLRADGQGGFHPPVSFVVQDAPRALDVGRLDADTNLDVLVGGHTSVSLLYGDGLGGFPRSLSVPIDAPVTASILGDFDADPWLDLAVATGETIRVFRGRGDGSFEPARTHATHLAGTALASGDLDGDARADLVVLGDYRRPGVGILFNAGDHNFLEPVILGVGAGIGCWRDSDGFTISSLLALGDFDADHRLDLLAATTSVGSILHHRLRGPTAIGLTDVQVSWDGERVRLDWRCQGLDGVTGIRVERSESPLGPFTPCTLAPLALRPSMSFDDAGVTPGKRYWYRILLVLRDGDVRFGAKIDIDLKDTASTTFDAAFQSGPGEPVRLRYSLPAASPVELTLFDIRGRKLGVIASGFAARGRHHVTWLPRDAQGGRLGRGLYVVRLRAGVSLLSRKLLLAHAP